MWRYSLAKRNIQGTIYNNLHTRIIYGETISYMESYFCSLGEAQLHKHNANFSTSVDLSKKTKEMLEDYEKRSLSSLLSLWGSTTCYKMYINVNNRRRTLKKLHSHMNVNTVTHLNLKEHQNTPDSSTSIPSGEISGDNIINLDESNFESELKKYKFTLVMFHAPWCQFCQNIKPLFYNLAQEITSDVVRLAMVDGDEFPTIALDNDVHVFPTFKLYRREVFKKNYDGPTEYSSLLEFIKSNITN